MTEVLADPIPEIRQSYPLKAARTVLDFAMREYLLSSGYYRSIGAQTSSEKYGGSRSLIYYQMLGRTSTLREFVDARKQYMELHDGTGSDEGGAMLRIVGYRVRNIPAVGNWFEAKIRQDDIKMAETTFTYPDGYDRVVGEPEDLKVYLARAQQRDRA
jgi:hypothetical protein